MSEHKFPYEWKISDGYPAKGIDYHGSKVFSCFACGGSTMGYKLAGYDVIGFNEIDPKMGKAYIENHKPKYSYIEPIQTFKDRDDLPEELYDLDIFEGSPPCSSFSIAGNREKDWGKEKKFREGQAKQVLDTLFFDFIDLAEKLKPKIIIAENVKGILLGNAQAYTRKILEDMEKAGYSTRYFLLNASKMGVPQRRERVFFIGIRKDLVPELVNNYHPFFNNYPPLDLQFNEKGIAFGEIKEDSGNDKNVSETVVNIWNHRTIKDISLRESNNRKEGRCINKWFSSHYIHSKNICNTLTASDSNILYDEPRFMNNTEIKRASSFPTDYDFGKNKVSYLCGMSVPPVMTAQIADRIYKQWLSKLK